MKIPKIHPKLLLALILTVILYVVSTTTIIVGTAPKVYNIYPDISNLNIYQKTKLSCARIQTKHSVGSGVILTKEGLIVTNHHVVGKSKEVLVVINAEKYIGKVVYLSKDLDIAFIKVVSDDDFRPIKIADYKTIAHGDDVFAIGNPLGIESVITKGIVSKFTFTDDSKTLIYTDANIVFGNSGGGLFNMRGELIGINTAAVALDKQLMGIGIAIAAKDVEPLLKNLLK